jgi:site-specific DNA recombinase
MIAGRHQVRRGSASRALGEPSGTPRAGTRSIIRKLRCAVYTRKSSEEGLDMNFNSLDAQREACEAYIASQRADGWVQVPDRYDNGGVSGGTLERPALKRLLADVKAGRIDIVVVYKIDRLSRSMLDFLNLVELFERHDTTFVSVTQSYSTKDAMGRMVLNIMVTFAQLSGRSLASASEIKSPPPGRRACGWAVGHRLATKSVIASLSCTKPTPNGSARSSGASLN